MSQQSIVTCSGPPKKFLKKGEGLKRFAAYKPPPPVSTNKFQRRQTFVKFKLDNRIKPSHFIDPELLSNESINLSTEIPKIAPPKIMHTPVRPNRQALGALKPSAFNCYASRNHRSDQNPIKSPSMRDRASLTQRPSNSDRLELFEATYQEAGVKNDRSITRKIVSVQTGNPDRMISFDGFRKPLTPDAQQTPPPVVQLDPTEPNQNIHSTIKQEETAPRRYNLRGSRKTNSESMNKPEVKVTQRKEPKRTKRQLKAVVERHISSTSNMCAVEDRTDEDQPEIAESRINGNIDILLKKIEEKKSSLEDDRTSGHDYESDNSVPLSPTISSNQHLKISPGVDLSNPFSGSCIIALGHTIERIQLTVNELQNKLKNCTCGAIIADQGRAGNPKSLRNTSRSRANDGVRPSAFADNTTPKILSSLEDHVAQLRARFDEMNLRK